MKAQGTFFRTASVSLVLAGIGFCSLGACSPGSNPEKSGTLTVTFPSTGAAIATDTLELRVYDASTVDGSIPNDCVNLLDLEKNSPQTLPTPLFDSKKLDTCNFFDTQVKPFDMGYGVRSFLVVGQRASADFVIGCTLTGIGDVSNSVNVDLAIDSGSTQIPASTTCSSLGDRCDKKLTCF